LERKIKTDLLLRDNPPLSNLTPLSVIDIERDAYEKLLITYPLCIRAKRGTSSPRGEVDARPNRRSRTELPLASFS